MGYWNDKVALVTGGSSGLGLAISRTLLRHGAQVTIVGRDARKLQDAAAGLDQFGDVFSCSADITIQPDVDRLFHEHSQRQGRLDILVNCAGKSMRGTALNTTVEQFQELWELNCLATIRCCRAAESMLKNSKGHLVNVGSLASKSVSKYLGAYPVSKFAAAAYTHQLRLELNELGVHVLLVCPGPIARGDAGDRYDDQAASLPKEARSPGGGVKLKGISPDRLAQSILHSCQKRKAELIVPWKAKLLFAISQLSPALGDTIVRKMTSKR